jgi:hypothetical protein
MASQANPTETYAPRTKGIHDLPPELRNQIYELCLLRHDGSFQVVKVTRDGPIQFLFSKQPAGRNAPIFHHQSPHFTGTRVPFMALTNFCVLEPALLRVSRATRHETLPMFYGANTFRLHHAHFLSDWLCYIGNERREVLRKVECLELPACIESLFMRSMVPPLHHMLLSMELFEATLAQQGLEVLTGVLRFSLFKSSLSGYSRQVHFRGWTEVNPPGTGALFWSSGFDVAKRLSDQDWQNYVDIRLAKSRDRRLAESMSILGLR